jgi:hypothetical protein
MTIFETMQIQGVWLHVEAEYTRYSPATLEQPEEPEGFEVAGVYLIPTDGSTKPLGPNIYELLSEGAQEAIEEELWATLGEDEEEDDLAEDAGSDE